MVLAETGDAMSSEVEAAAALATAGLVARAVEPETGERSDDGHARTCLNCGTALTGPYCHVCGQAAHLHRSVPAVFEEFIHGILHLDTKAWRTLPLLAVRPGKLTHDYIHGKRARFITPLGLFLFSIFLMFFVFGFLPPQDGLVSYNASTTPAERQADVERARAELAEAQADLAKAEQALTAMRSDPGTPPGELRAQETAVALARTGLATVEGALAREEAALAAARDPGATAAPKETWQDGVRNAIESGDLMINVGNPDVEARMKAALMNPDLVLYKVQQKAYKLSFLLVPLSLPFLWLMFAWKRDVRLYDHVVFALYSIAFMSILFVIVSLISRVTGTSGGLAGALTVFVPPIHMFLHLRGTYGLSRASALWRTVFLLFSAMIVLTLFVTIILLLGLLD
jgi:hypothetical protein